MVEHSSFPLAIATNLLDAPPLEPDLQEHLPGRLVSCPGMRYVHINLLTSIVVFVCLFDLIIYVPSTIFQLNRDGSSWVEPVLSWDKCVLLKDNNAVTPMRLKSKAPRSQVKHSTTEPLCSPIVFIP